MARILFRIVISLAFDGVNMKQNRCTETLGSLQSLTHHSNVMSVNRSHVSESHFFKNCAFVNEIFYRCFETEQSACHAVSDKRNSVKETLKSCFHSNITFLWTDFSEIFCNRADIFRNWHLIIIENNDKICLWPACVIECLINKSARKRAVTDNSNRIIIVLFYFIRFCNAESRGNRRSAVSAVECVVLTLIRMTKSRYSVLLAYRIKDIVPTCQKLMRICLVTDVPNDSVLRRVKRQMNCNCQFNCAKIGRKMTAVFWNGINKYIPYFLRKLGIFGAVKLFQISRRMYFIEIFYFLIQYSSHPIKQVISSFSFPFYRQSQ